MTVQRKRPLQEHRYQGHAERAALRQYLADVPDPAEFADLLLMNKPQVAALLVDPARVYRGMAQDGPTAESLRRYSLCEVNGRGLTAFGLAVMRALRETKA